MDDFAFINCFAYFREKDAAFCMENNTYFLSVMLTIGIIAHITHAVFYIIHGLYKMVVVISMYYFLG